MTTALNITMTGQVKGTETNTLALVTATAPINQTYNYSWGSGAVANLYSNTSTITTGGSAIALNNGSVSDCFGNALTFALVMGVWIVNNDATNYVTVGGGTDPIPGMTTSTIVEPGGCFMLTNPAGYAVGSSTYNINLTAHTASVSVSIMVVGD